MKKFLAFVLAAGLCVSGGVPAFAQTVNSEKYGISYTLSDDWVLVSDDESVIYQHVTTNQEGLRIEYVEQENAYSMELIDEEKIKELCEKMYSDATLAEELRESNNTFLVTVTTDSVIESYEYYNDVCFFRYEKAYTARAYGYRDTPFYETIYVTAKNGKLYFISYQRNSQSNHFADLTALLDSLSFENGEIKIEMNGERIRPDSAPMLIEGRTLVPIRAIAEKMGYSVNWDANQKLVTLTAAKGVPILHFEIGSNTALKNLSEELTLDVPAMIVGDRTYLPLRAVAEAMDADVNWNDGARTVEITYKK